MAESFLQAQGLQPGKVVVGSFEYDEVIEVLNLDSDVQPLSLMPVGRK